MGFEAESGQRWVHVLRDCNMLGIIRDPEAPHSGEIGKAIRTAYRAPEPQCPMWKSDALCPFESLMNSHVYLTGDRRTAVRHALALEVKTFGGAPEGSLLADLLAVFVE